MNPKTNLALMMLSAWDSRNIRRGNTRKNPDSPALKMAERKRHMRAEKLKNQLKKD